MRPSGIEAWMRRLRVSFSWGWPGGGYARLQVGERVVFLSATAGGWWWVRQDKTGQDGWHSPAFLRHTGEFRQLASPSCGHGSVKPLRVHTDGSTDPQQGMAGCYVARELYVDATVFHPGP